MLPCALGHATTTTLSPGAWPAPVNVIVKFETKRGISSEAVATVMSVGGSDVVVVAVGGG